MVFVHREGHYPMLLDLKDAAVHISSRDADFRFPPSDTSHMRRRAACGVSLGELAACAGAAAEKSPRVPRAGACLRVHS